MKKLLTLPLLFLLAAGCNSNQPVVEKNQQINKTPVNTPTQQIIPSAQNTNQTTPKKWQSYTNTRVGYSFEYPEKMEVYTVFKQGDNKLVPNLDTVVVRPVIIAGGDVPRGVDLNLYNVEAFINEGYSSIENWITDTNNTHGIGGTNKSIGHNLSQYQKMTLGGKAAYKLTLDYGVFVVTLANGNVYIIRVFDETHTNSFNNYPTLEHLISSFKLVR